MRIRNALLVGSLALALVASSGGLSSPQAKTRGNTVAGTRLVSGVPAEAEAAFAVATPQCDESLWDHVYHGKFATAKDRLKVKKDCITVTGTIASAPPEKDGDYHIRLTVDSQFTNLLNAKNKSGQGGHLVVEPMCEAPVIQQDTIDEGVCNGFKQKVFTLKMKGKHVSVTGAYVTDMEHGWNEIHPVSSIRVTP